MGFGFGFCSDFGLGFGLASTLLRPTILVAVTVTVPSLSPLL
jgi:hypothetical protein